MNAQDIRDNIETLSSVIHKDIKEAFKDKADLPKEEAREILEQIIYNRLLELENELCEKRNEKC
jgi:hypothetical protein